MKHIENFNHWYDGILNSWPFLIDDTSVKSAGMAIGYMDNKVWHESPRSTGNDHQYFNARFFVRIVWPFGLFFHIRWTDKVFYWPKWVYRIGGKQVQQFCQFGIGYKMSGRFAIHYRAQTDASAAVGYHPGLPNLGHATGFNYGGA